MKKKKANKTPSIENRKARFKYQILDTFEAGMSLMGSEVKSIRLGQISLQEGYVVIKRFEAFLMGSHIAPFEQAGLHQQHPPIRQIRLLLHKKEILKLKVKTEQDGLALIPLKIYFTRGKIKLSLALGRGKKLFDKRQDLKTKAIEKNLRKKFKI